MVTRLPAGAEPPLVGRQGELDALWHQFTLAARGGTRVVLIAGEPGIGKTRLLDAIGGRAAGAGGRPLRGGASEAEGMPPYLPFLEALGQHVREASGDALRQQAGALAPVLATILPELVVRLGTLESTYTLPPDQARLRLFEAVHTFLAAVANGDRRVVLFDDLQWVDPASLDLLCYVARQRSAARLLIVGAYRDGELEQNPALVRAVAELNRLRILNTFTLSRLTLPEVTALSEEYLGGPLDAAAVQPLFEHSEGNPFFVEELLLVWLESGALVRVQRADDLPLHVLAPGSQLALPPGIVSAVRQRLVHLSADIVDLLRSAAIVGRTFETELLAAVAGLDVESVEERLQEVVRAKLLRVGDSGDFSFSHDKIRESLYEDVTPARRRRLHGFIGHALEARAEPAGAQRLAELAFHFGRSGDRARGALYASRAADDALRAYAPAEAMAHHQTALSLVAPDDPKRGELLLALGESALLAGAGEVAVRAFTSARAWLQTAGDVVGAARAAQNAGHAWWRQEAIDKARAAFEDALMLLHGSQRPELVAVLVDLGSILAGNLHQHAEGIAHTRRALALARALGEPQVVVTATRALGNLLVRSNALREGIALLEEALNLATSVDSPLEAAECYAGLASAYFWQGRLRRSREMTIRRLAFAERCHDLYQLRHVYTWIAFVGAFLGETAEVDARLDQARAILEDLASPEPRAFFHFVCSIVALVRGEHDDAERQMQAAVEIFRSIGPGALVWYLPVLGLVQALQGRQAEARACVDEVESLLARVPESTMVAADPLAYLVTISLVLDDRARLARYQPRLAAFRGQFHDMLIERLLGEIAVSQGDWDAALRHLRTAEAAARQEGLAWELARALEAQAVVLTRSRRDARASVRPYLEEALHLYERLGNQCEATRLREQVTTLSEGGARGRLPSGLTRREAEVLRLIAGGLSNRDVADALNLSEKTVENHLTSVYGKIGADNRAAASAFAVRHGLA